MVSVLHNELSSPTYFPPGSLESQNDSLGNTDHALVSSPHFESPKNEKTIIDYIEVPSERKHTLSTRISKAPEEIKTAGDKTQKFSKKEKEVFNFVSFDEESKNLIESDEEKNDRHILALEIQLNNYKELIHEYESSLKMIKGIFDGIKSLAFQSFKSFPNFDDANLKNARQSLENISLYIKNMLVEKSIKKSSKVFEGKRIKCLKLDNVYPSIIIPESPEPPRQPNIIRRQSSIAGKEDYKRPKSDAIFLVQQQKNGKSVSPILKMKYKPGVIKVNRC